MSTLVNPKTRAVVASWERNYASAVFSGIRGDANHIGGYHISIEDQSSTNYSVIRPDDKAPPGNWARNEAAAIDISMSKADMITATRRWMAVWSDRTDPRRIYFNAFNGWLGSGNAQRWDFVSNSVGTATNDHQWHKHYEIRRRYINEPIAYQAIESINNGESKATWITNHGGGSTPPPVDVPVGKPGTRDIRLTSPMMRGDDVAFVQRWIKGGSGITVDGIYGPKTRSRFIWWQQMRGRTGTGVVSRIDWQEMGVTVRY